MKGLTYDAGVLIASERGDRRVWLMHSSSLKRGQLPTVPTIILVEAWRGSAEVARLLEGCQLEELDERQGKAAGALRGRCTGSVEAADAVVVEGALRRGDAVVTSNRSHIEALAEGVGRRVAIIDV